MALWARILPPDFSAKAKGRDRFGHALKAREWIKNGSIFIILAHEQRDVFLIKISFYSGT